jgi:hypothetical protein
MSIKYLITPSLLGSFVWYLSDESEDSREKFLQTLERVRTPKNPAQQKGIDFENAVFGYCCLDKQLPIINPITQIGDIVKGGLWQQSVKKEIKVGNQDFLLYGRTDVIKHDTVYDIKYTRKYDLGKFLDSAQHLIYLYCTGLLKFQYLISDGKDYWIEDYHNHANIENEIKGKISDFLGYLENDKEAKELFETKWRAKYD